MPNAEWLRSRVLLLYFTNAARRLLPPFLVIAGWPYVKGSKIKLQEIEVVDLMARVPTLPCTGRLELRGLD